MRIFYHPVVDLLARRLLPGVAVAAFAAWGIAYGGPELQDIPDILPSAQAAELNVSTEGQTDEMSPENVVSESFTDGTYQDGVYTGTAKGFGGDITVQVTISGGKITDISIVSASGETPSYLERAKAVISSILTTQSPNVDVVSGATYSSNGIINAVKRALAQASTSGGADLAVTETSSDESSSGGGSTTQDSYTDPSAYTDGTYTGTAEGFGGDITVRVTVSGGKITAIDIVSAAGETASYMERAKGVIAKVLAQQTPNVDVVSGATYSSNGILNAIKRALSIAGTSSSTSDTQTPSGGASDSAQTPAQGEDINPSAYQDGSYMGTAEGFGGDITVKVTVSGGKITAVDIISAADETPSYLAKAEGVIPQIISEQSVHVDVISGATYSSNGILQAVKQALSQAERLEEEEPEIPEEPETPEEPEEPETPEEPEEPETPESEENTQSEDYVYTVTVPCVPDEMEDFETYEMTVAVTVTETTKTETTYETQNGSTVAVMISTVTRAVSDLAVIQPDESSSNWRYITWALEGRNGSAGMRAQVIERQSFADLDAVTRATCSSNAIVVAGETLSLSLGTTESRTEEEQ